MRFQQQGVHARPCACAWPHHKLKGLVALVAAVEHGACTCSAASRPRLGRKRRRRQRAGMLQLQRQLGRRAPALSHGCNDLFTRGLRAHRHVDESSAWLNLPRCPLVNGVGERQRKVT